MFYTTRLFDLYCIDCLDYSILHYTFTYVGYGHLNILSLVDNTATSICDIYGSASWYERESSELLGIYFNNTVDTRNLLLQYGNTMYPLRKLRSKNASICLLAKTNVQHVYY